MVKKEALTFPKLVNGCPSWLSANIKQYANIRLNERAKSIEEPPMTI